MKNKAMMAGNGLKRRLLPVGISFILVLLVISLLPIGGQSFWDRLSKWSGLHPYAAYIEDYPVNIYFLDVGKADAIILECEGEYALLDAGTADRADDIIVALRRLGVERLSCLFASHPDKDHIGSMAQIIARYPVDLFVEPVIPEELLPNTDEFGSMNEMLREKAVPVETVTAGAVYSLGGAVIEVLSPAADAVYHDVNDCSLVLKFRYKNFSALLCGDIEKQAEADLCGADVDLSATVIKIAHHGSKTSSAEEFLQQVGARYAVISVGPDRNNLPKNQVLKRLDEMEIEVYRTDYDGTVIFSSDGDDIKIYQENAE